MPDPITLAQHEHGQRLRMSFLLLTVLMLAGAAGFYFLGDGHTFFQCLYLTSVILTTVGMKGKNFDMNAMEEGWALVLMLGGISLALYAATNLVAFIVEGELARTFGRRHLQKQIEKLHNHTIIIGFGRMGRSLCALLKERGLPFVLVERDPAMTMEADGLSYLYVQGDAVADGILAQAGATRATKMVCCLPRESDNVFVMLKVRELNPDMMLIARGQNVENESMLKRAGANRVIVTPVLGATRVMQMLTMPAVAELVDLAVSGEDIEVSKMELMDLPQAIGKTLRELSLPAKTGLMVVALIHADGSRQFNPTPDSNLAQTDQMIVIGRPGGVEKLVKAYGPEPVRV